MKKWLKRILIGIVGIILLVVVLFYSVRAYLYVSSEKSYGEYSTRIFFSPAPFMCGTEVITETGSLWPLMNLELCEANVQDIRRTGDWLEVQVDGMCNWVERKNMVTGEKKIQMNTLHPACRIYE